MMSETIMRWTGGAEARLDSRARARFRSIAKPATQAYEHVCWVRFASDAELRERLEAVARRFDEVAAELHAWRQELDCPLEPIDVAYPIRIAQALRKPPRIVRLPEGVRVVPGGES